MVMYWCSSCGELIDDDWDPMDESERCPSCAEIAAEDE